MQLNWEKYRADFRKFAEGFVKALSKFVKIEKVEFDESVGDNFQDVIVFYINAKTERLDHIRLSTFPDTLPPTIENALRWFFHAAGLREWWCYRRERSRNIVVSSDNVMGAPLTINILSIPWDWADVDRPVEVELWHNHKKIYNDYISIFDIFDFVVVALTLTNL